MSKSCKIILLSVLLLISAYVCVGIITYEPVIIPADDSDAMTEVLESIDYNSFVRSYLDSSLGIYPKIPLTAQIVKNTVDNCRIGTGTLKYSLSYFDKQTELVIRVNVIDTTAPVITLTNNDDYHYTRLSGYTEEGYTATDNFDGDLTQSVNRMECTDYILYTICDSSGNTSVLRRELSYDKSNPQISAPTNIVLTIYHCYDYPTSAKADDGWGNDISDKVTVTSDVRPITGTYTLTYSITDEDGVEHSSTGSVEIVNNTSLKNNSSSSKVIYLTFDDGPSANTSRLLDILDIYGVKATFFVTGSKGQYTDLIGEEYRRGHTVAAHTYSHDYTDIYSSEEAYFEDLNKIENVIYAQTGHFTSLIRFPGGSSNTVSSFNPGIMTTLTTAVREKGYQYFDWNVSSGDGGSELTSEQVLENVKTGCLKHSSNIVLQRDTKSWSVDAVAAIIEWGLENGYEFRTLDTSSYYVHHGTNN